MRVVFERKRGGERVFTGAACVVDRQLRVWLVDEEGRRRRLGHCVDRQANAWRLVGGDRAHPPTFHGDHPDSSDLRLSTGEQEICGAGEHGYYRLRYHERPVARVTLDRQLDASAGHRGRLPEFLSLDPAAGWRYLSWWETPPEILHGDEVVIAPAGFSLLGVKAAQAAKAASLHPRHRRSPLAERALA